MLPALRSAVGATTAQTAAFTAAVADGRAYPAVADWTDVEAELQHDLSDLWRAVLDAGGPLSRQDVDDRVTTSAEHVAAVTSG